MLFQSPETSQVLQTTMDYGTNGEKNGTTGYIFKFM